MRISVSEVDRGIRLIREKFNKTHGDTAIQMASHVISELHGINNFGVQEWIEYYDVNYLKKCLKPHKKTLLHNYIEHIYDFQISYILDKHFSMEVINELLEIFDLYNIDYTSISKFEFRGMDDDEVYGEIEDVEVLAYSLYELYKDKIMSFVVDDIFTTLYSNKKFLYDFNSQLAELISNLNQTEYPEFLKKDGVMKRCEYIPQWLKDGVFYRDKGRCQICGRDLTRLLNLDNTINYDHIIPLENGGTNDPTNFQITCENCNKSKGARNSEYNNIADSFWTLDSYKLFDDI